MTTRLKTVERLVEGLRRAISRVYKLEIDAIGIDVYIHRCEGAWNEASKADYERKITQGVDRWFSKGDMLKGISITIFRPFYPPGVRFSPSPIFLESKPNQEDQTHAPDKEKE